MKIAFLTEMGFEGKVNSDYPNMRTEFAWMNALNADHYHISNFQVVKNYDHIFLIFPKGMTYLNSIGVKLSDQENPISYLLRSNIIEVLKRNNKKIHFVQEGPHWLWNDYELDLQIHYHNMISSCDSIFCHNNHDVLYYKGLYPNVPVNVIPSLMIDDLVTDIASTKQNKVIIGGNFSRWYGGFESYIVADVFETDIWTQESHAKRKGEESMHNLKHLNRMDWIGWMKELSTFKYAVHLMPTVAAGTFSLNCAYFGIPCIGNLQVDTQKLCHPNLLVNVNDVKGAIELAKRLKIDDEFYDECSTEAKNNYKLHFNKDFWKTKILNILS